MSSEKSANEKYKSKNSSLQDYKGQKKWSSRGELSSHSSATLEYPSKNSKKVGSLSDDEDERNNSKKKRKLFAFSSKSKRERNGSGDVKKKSKNKDEFSKDGGQKQRAARSNTISELSVAQLQKRLSREVKPIFGVELEDAVKQSKSLDGIELPLIIRECIDHVEGFGLDTPGIYRISGIKSKIEALKISYNSGQSVDLKDYDVTVVTGLLKQYLRELPESVLTQELNSRFEEASAVPNDNLRVEEFLGVLNELPTCNYTLLSWIIIHLVHVMDYADVNKMSIQNLSIVFSPTMRITHRVLFQLFTNWDIFFGHVKLKKCKKPLQLDSSGQVQLPDGVEELEEELQFHESLLNKMHEDLNKGVASHGTEEELWEVQRIVTQMKRKLRKAKSVQKQAAPKQQEDDKSDSVDQLSTDSKMDDGSSTGTDENKLTEGGEKDIKDEDITKEEEKPVAAAGDGEDVVAPTDAAEVKPVSPEEVTVEIEEKEEDKDQPTKEKETKEEEQGQEEEDVEEEIEEQVEEEEEESLESLYLYYSELTAKQEELKNIRSELQRRIEMEQLEVARLKAEVEAAKVEPKMRASNSSSVDLSDNSSSDSEEEEELQAILKKLQEDNERLKKDNEDSSLMILTTREECADLKAKINVETHRSEIIKDLQDELEKDKAKKEKMRKKKKKKMKKDKDDEKGEEDEKGDDADKKAIPEGGDVFGVSEC